MTAKSAVSLSIEAVGHSYRDLRVLDDITLSIPAGQVTVLVGPSGCGKSTLLGILGGLIAPRQGRVLMDGPIAPDCLNNLTYVFQDFALLPWRDVAGNVALGLQAAGLSRDARAARVAEVLALTGLTDFATAWPKQLSGGMRQRVGIARALAVRPAVLLMDEPLSALDAQTRALLLEEFSTLIAASGVTTIYVTHTLSEAALLGQQIVVLSRRPGRIRDIIRIDRPLIGRRPGDPDLMAIESRLWALIRDDAADAAREFTDAGG